MADFRKWYPVLAVVALLVGSAMSASAQPAFTCSTNAGVPPLVRAEGLAELVGDVILNCTGGISTAAGAVVPQVNVQIFLNTNITSRLLNDPWSEALLMIDEPGPSVQRTCTSSPCTVYGVGTAAGFDGLTDGVDYDSPDVSTPNVYQGRQVGANSVVWLGVPIDPPGTLSTRIIRITNVRSNANQLGVSSTLIPTQIVMFISATGTTSIPINNPQQTVAFIQPGMTFDIRNSANDGGGAKTLLQCVSNNKDLSTDSSKTNGVVDFQLRFRESFATAFKYRNVATTAGSSYSADVSPTPMAQNTPGAIYNTETGFYNPSFTTTNGLYLAGLADHGTRLMARFANVPAGVAIYVTTRETSSASSTLDARLVTTDVNGAGAFSATAATGSSDKGAIAPVSIVNGAGQAVWEIMLTTPLANENALFGVVVAYTANTSANLPGLGQSTASGTFAPLSTVTTASSSAPLPRFADTSVARNTFLINACTTNLLFVFVSNQLGFDTGLAISNTSLDPYGTTPQQGACQIYYYGETTGGGAAPATQTSGVVAAGKQLVWTLSSGGNLGIAATPGFQGYIMAKCAFQFAHGFAFISDVGANRVSEAYLALVLDGQWSGYPRTGVVSEVLGH